MLLKAALLVVLGLLWSGRIAAIKAAGLAGVPVYVVVAVSVLGVAIFLSALAAWRHDWPPLDRTTVPFYAIGATLGIAPFAIESAVAPNLPVFVFVVIIATMPLLTFVLSALTGRERVRLVPLLAIGLGFAGAALILWDTARDASIGGASTWWVVAAFAVPFLYAASTVFVASRWPARAGPLHVAHAQATLAAVVALLASFATGAIGDWSLVALNAPAVGLIVLGEGLAIVLYLRITRDYGATWVSFANYASIVFAAGLGAVWFGDRVSGLTVAGALAIVGSVVLHQRIGGSPDASRTEGNRSSAADGKHPADRLPEALGARTDVR